MSKIVILRTDNLLCQIFATMSVRLRSKICIGPTVYSGKLQLTHGTGERLLHTLLTQFSVLCCVQINGKNAVERSSSSVGDLASSECCFSCCISLLLWPRRLQVCTQPRSGISRVWKTLRRPRNYMLSTAQRLLGM